MGILTVENRMGLAALLKMSLKLAGQRDPERLLQYVSHIAREIIHAEYASVAIPDDDGSTFSRVFCSGMDAATVIPVVRPGIWAKMLVDLRPLRLRDVTSESLGFPAGAFHLSSVLGVPISSLARAHGWLFLANRLGTGEFSDADENMAVTFATQLAFAYERVNQQKRADEELCESKDVHEAMFESAPDGIAAVNEHGRIVQVNAQTQKLFGYTRAELVGQSVEILVPEQLRAAHPDRLGEGLELIGRRKDASEFPVEITLSSLETKRGRLMLSVVRDATARKQNEQHIRQLNLSLAKHVEELQTANQELEGFSYSVSHDLRAPLRQIDGFARILRERVGAQADADTSHYFERIQNAVVHMGSLLEGLLDLGRLGRQGLRVQLTDLNLLASQAVEELKLDAPDRQIEWILDPLPAVQCDTVLVKAVFVNLLSNAVKFTRPREVATIRVSCRFENGETIIFIADNGVGFNMKYADKLFGIFQRLHRSEDFPGTGMGLATVQRIIQKHGGRIWAESAINSRTAFYFTLAPVNSEQAEESKRKNEVIHD
jgi:PAS domain S-box-containing protein